MVFSEFLVCHALLRYGTGIMGVRPSFLYARVTPTRLQAHKEGAVLSYVFQYNRLEGVFLVCAMTILLCGMIFESNFFKPGTHTYILLTWVVRHFVRSSRVLYRVACMCLCLVLSFLRYFVRLCMSVWLRCAFPCCFISFL